MNDMEIPVFIVAFCCSVCMYIYTYIFNFYMYVYAQCIA